MDFNDTPEEAAFRAEARAWLEANAEPLAPGETTSSSGAERTTPEQVQAWSRGFISQGFEALEALVTEVGGRCCVGNAVRFADLCLVPQLYNARRFDVDLSQFPRLLAIEEDLETLPAFAAAHPREQPDAA